MQFYREKFTELRKMKKIKLTVLAKKLNMSRITLWHWEKGTRTPSEKQLREIAKEMGVAVDAFSNLKREVPVSEKGMNEEAKAVSRWISFDEQEFIKRKKHQSLILKDIVTQFNEAALSVRLLQTLINLGEVMLYVKDTSQKYITASKAFLDTISLSSESSIIGQADTNLFSTNDAKENFEEDEQVILTGEPVKSREGFIPGTRKQNWGLISKIPTFDSEGKITGLVGSFVDITRRKKAEYIAEMLRKGLNLLHDKMIFMHMGELTSDETNSIIPKKMIYISDNNMSKRFYQKMPGASFREIVNFLNSLKIEKPIPDFKTLREKGYSCIRFKMKAPDNDQEIINIKATIHYSQEDDLYFSFFETDKIRSLTEEIGEILRKNKIKESIIREISDLTFKYEDNLAN